MTIALWVVTGLLAVIFAAAGLAKATTPKASLHKKGMTYVEDFSDGQIKAIGIAEVLGAVGLIVPVFISSITWLVPTAAIALALTMVGAVVVHAKRKEPFVPALVLGVLAALVAFGRIWIAPF